MTDPTERTAQLLKALAGDADAVRPLPGPHARMMAWFLLSLSFAVAAAWIIGPRPDLSARLTDTFFIIETAAAVLTSMMAAAAAFCSGCPGRPRWEQFVALPFVVLWIGSLGFGCLGSLAGWVENGGQWAMDLVCFPYIAAISSLPLLLILTMIRRLAPLAPATTTGMATLAASALGAAALRFVHVRDASLMVLVWQVGSVALLTGIAAALGKTVIRWPHEARQHRLIWSNRQTDATQQQ